MSLDNTSQSGRPGLDELVPSRYALRVGEIDVLVISDGVLSLPGAMLGHNADPAVRAAWLKDMFLPPDLLEWALNVVVVHSGGRTILIDAGLGSDPDLHLPRAGRLVQRLEAAGIDLASVTDVVLTHMHMDHVGGLLVDGVRDRLRPDLRVHLAAAEAEFWESPDFSRVNMPPGFPDALRRTAKRFLNEFIHLHGRSTKDRLSASACRTCVGPTSAQVSFGCGTTRGILAFHVSRRTLYN